MAGNTRMLINPQDVYAFTDKGSHELRGTHTALSQQRLEVLVLVDGVASVETISRSVRTLKPEGVMQLVGDIVADGYITKPFEVDVLMAEVKVVLGLP